MTKFTFALLLTLMSPMSWSCSCNIGDVPEKFKNHVSIFQGVVTDLIFYEQQDAFGDQYIKVTFEVEKQWKGESNQSQLLTVYNGASCFGYWFKEKRRYIIYAFEEGETLNAWWCGGVISEYDNKESFEEEVSALNKLTSNGAGE